METVVDIAAIRAAMEDWYNRCARNLPWRQRRDPYAIWISEVMLQQTRVATVTGYYRRFLQRFPTAEALAAAPLSAVLKAWEGMGYYSRARNLHAAARKLAADFGGKLPADVASLRSLPGVGPYTAAAVASIAFGLDEAVVDGNVARVLARVFLIRRNVKLPAVHRRLVELAGSLVPPGKAGMMNQALMDLGATVCTPRGPRCDDCPLRRFCLALAAGCQNDLPVKPPRKTTPHYDVAVGVVVKAGRVLIDLRKPEGLLGGLWEFPGGKRGAGESLEHAVVREVREEVGIEVEPTALLAVVRHAYTHFRITMHAYECRHMSGRARPIACDAVKWVHLSRLDDYAFPKANHKVIAALRERRG